MIEERASVVSVEDDRIWVQTQRKSVCGACSARKGCGTASLDQLFGHRRTQMMVSSELPVNTGDEVILGIEESTLLRGSLLLYGLPLLFLIAGAIVMSSIVPAAGELYVIFGAVTGLLVGLYLVAGYSRRLRLNPSYHPTIQRVISPSNLHSKPVLGDILVSDEVDRS